MVKRILTAQNLGDALSQVLQGLIELISTSQIFEMTPKAFDRVQGWAILRQPKDTHQVIGSLADRESRNAFLLTTLHPTSSQGKP
jgi:hypothetical protein